MKVLGAVIAGGRNTRYGGLKAFAEVGGVSILDRVIAAMRHVTGDVVIIANDPAPYAAAGLPVRSDEVATGAPLAGLLTALRWSEERGAEGIIAVACDMPFTNGGLLRQLVATAESEAADVVAPESGGRRGVEPLCAFYSTRCIAAIESAIAREDLRTIGFYDDVKVVALAIDQVREFGEPATLFMNVNTREELAAAASIAEGGL